MNFFNLIVTGIWQPFIFIWRKKFLPLYFVEFIETWSDPGSGSQIFVLIRILRNHTGSERIWISSPATNLREGEPAQHWI